MRIDLFGEPEELDHKGDEIFLGLAGLLAPYSEVARTFLSQVRSALQSASGGGRSRAMEFEKGLGGFTGGDTVRHLGGGVASSSKDGVAIDLEPGSTRMAEVVDDANRAVDLAAKAQADMLDKAEEIAEVEQSWREQARKAVRAMGVQLHPDLGEPPKTVTTDERVPASQAVNDARQNAIEAAEVILGGAGELGTSRQIRKPTP